MRFDTVIRNGTVVTASDTFVSDVGIKDGRICAIGRLRCVRATRWLSGLIRCSFAGGGGADIGPLRPLGSTLAGLRPDSQRYFDHHHAANDVFEMVSKRELELGAINMVLLLYVVDQYGL